MVNINAIATICEFSALNCIWLSISIFKLVCVAFTVLWASNRSIGEVNINIIYLEEKPKEFQILMNVYLGLWGSEETIFPFTDSGARFLIYGWGRQSMLGVGTRNLMTAIYGYHIWPGAFILSIARRKYIFPGLACEGNLTRPVYFVKLSQNKGCIHQLVNLLSGRIVQITLCLAHICYGKYIIVKPSYLSYPSKIYNFV